MKIRDIIRLDKGDSTDCLLYKLKNDSRLQTEDIRIV